MGLQRVGRDDVASMMKEKGENCRMVVELIYGGDEK